MRCYATYLFDLDGTLTDSKVGITNSLRYALSKMFIADDGHIRLDKFIGPPLLESFKKHYSLEDDEARQAVAYYREYYAEKGIFENMVYEGIPAVLADLDRRGGRLILATSKASVYAQRVLVHFGLDRYFDGVYGSHFDLSRASKTEIIGDILNEMNHREDGGFVMVGDHPDDVFGARENGVDSIAVTYGYGSEEELREAQPTYTVHSVQELATLLDRLAGGPGRT